MVFKTISPGCGVRASPMLFYCATIAYHVELNVDLGRPQAPANVQEKWMFSVDRGPRLSYHGVLPHSSFFSCWPYIFRRVFIARKEVLIFYRYTCRWILKLQQFPYFVS